MQATQSESTVSPCNGAILRLLVRNHAGVMSHICGLFARRAFNVEAIVCLPIGDRSHSAVLLQIDQGERIDQLLCQLRKLEDVMAVEAAPDAAAAFAAMESWCR